MCVLYKRLLSLICFLFLLNYFSMTSLAITVVKIIVLLFLFYYLIELVSLCVFVIPNQCPIIVLGLQQPKTLFVLCVKYKPFDA